MIQEMNDLHFVKQNTITSAETLLDEFEICAKGLNRVNLGFYKLKSFVDYDKISEPNYASVNYPLGNVSDDRFQPPISQEIDKIIVLTDDFENILYYHLAKQLLASELVV